MECYFYTKMRNFAEIYFGVVNAEVSLNNLFSSTLQVRIGQQSKSLVCADSLFRLVLVKH